MARKVSMSQFKSQMRQAQSKLNRAVNSLNSDIRKYNTAVRQYNSKVRSNRNKINQEIRKLNNSTQRIRITNYSTSVHSLNSVYEKIAIGYDNQLNLSKAQEAFYEQLEQENANSLQTANVIVNGHEPENQNVSLNDTIIGNKLSNISVELNNRWMGALFSLNPSNPDAARHFCTSTREIFTQIFDIKAKDEDVFVTFPNCEKTNRGNATRKFKIKYFLLKKGLEFENADEFIEKDIDNILELFHTLNTGTHGETGVYTINQLQSIKKRVEDGLLFLCEIVN